MRTRTITFRFQLNLKIDVRAGLRAPLFAPCETIQEGSLFRRGGHGGPPVH